MRSFQINKSIVIITLLIIVCVAGVFAQCPMCKIAAESNLAHGGTEGKGLNTGILYMLSLPYVLIGTLSFLWWKHNRSQMDEEREKDEAIRDLIS